MKIKVVIILGWLSLLTIDRLLALDIQLDFSSSMGYRGENEDYLLPSSQEEWSNATGQLEATLITRGKLPNGTSGALEFSVTGSPSAAESLNIAVGEAYGTLVPVDFVFFTVGRIRKKFGNAYFTNLSNRISPMVRTTQGIKQDALPLTGVEVMVAEGLSVSSILWFPDELRWDVASYAISSHLCRGGFDGSIHVYWEASQWPAVGVNMAYGTDWFLLYGEGLWKKRSDQEYVENGSVWRKEHGVYAGAVGLTLFWKELSFGLEWWGREEGYSQKEQETVYDLIQKVKNGTLPASSSEATFVQGLSYTPFEWGRYYAGFWIQYQQVLGISDLSVSGYGALSFDGMGVHLGVQGSYWVDDRSLLWSRLVWYGGEMSSEFKRLIPEQFSFEIGIKVSL
ncbi:MAG TPA: hypothetical protein PLW34_02450 [Termitinemataceae bacterium]|nr:hypothetical protein [Termitinemataceae bacterium]HOM23614.1 hypothetical protein [Termitinemataceae bacterium]HPP99714.1 hypothetical protein [Termitinemataceae bacterium]